MTNREWLLNKMQNMSDEEVASKVTLYDERDCSNQDCTGTNCLICKIKWLKSEHKEKITLSEAERIILENIDKEYCYIARDRTGFLTVFLGKPRKGSDIWESRGFKHCYINCFNHLFQFITWENKEAYDIEELLKQ